MANPPALKRRYDSLVASLQRSETSTTRRPKDAAQQAALITKIEHAKKAWEDAVAAETSGNSVFIASLQDALNSASTANAEPPSSSGAFQSVQVKREALKIVIPASVNRGQPIMINEDSPHPAESEAPVAAGLQPENPERALTASKTSEKADTCIPSKNDIESAKEANTGQASSGEGLDNRSPMLLGSMDSASDPLLANNPVAASSLLESKSTEDRDIDMLGPDSNTAMPAPARVHAADVPAGATTIGATVNPDGLTVDKEDFSMHEIVGPPVVTTPQDHDMEISPKVKETVEEEVEITTTNQKGPNLNDPLDIDALIANSQLFAFEFKEPDLDEDETQPSWFIEGEPPTRSIPRRHFLESKATLEAYLSQEKTAIQERDNLLIDLSSGLATDITAAAKYVGAIIQAAKQIDDMKERVRQARKQFEICESEWEWVLQGDDVIQAQRLEASISQSMQDLMTIDPALVMGTRENIMRDQEALATVKARMEERNEIIESLKRRRAQRAEEEQADVDNERNQREDETYNPSQYAEDDDMSTIPTTATGKRSRGGLAGRNGGRVRAERSHKKKGRAGRGATVTSDGEDQADAGSETGASKKKAKAIPYDDLNDESKQALIKEGKTALNAYIRTKNPADFPTTYRKLVRDVQDYLPEAAQHSHDLSLLILTSNRTNTACLYHHHQRKDREDHDSITQFFGVGYKPKIETFQSNVVPPPPGHLHCGCLVDDAILELHLWKTTKLQSSNPQLAQYTYPINMEVTPKIRAFWLQTLKNFTGLSAADLIEGHSGGGHGTDQFRITLALKQLHVQYKRLKRRNVGIGLQWKNIVEGSADAKELELYETTTGNEPYATTWEQVYNDLVEDMQIDPLFM